MYDVSQQALVAQMAERLQDKIAMPDWAQFVKTGVHKERPPVEDDWWYKRAASVLRQVQLKGPIGVSKLRYKYGGRKTNKGMEPEKFHKGSGKIIRTILQQFEEIGFMEHDDAGVHKGRVTTSDGEEFIFQTAEEMK